MLIGIIKAVYHSQEYGIPVRGGHQGALSRHWHRGDQSRGFHWHCSCIYQVLIAFATTKWGVHWGLIDVWEGLWSGLHRRLGRPLNILRVFCIIGGIRRGPDASCLLLLKLSPLPTLCVLEYVGTRGTCSPGFLWLESFCRGSIFVGPLVPCILCRRATSRGAEMEKGNQIERHSYYQLRLLLYCWSFNLSHTEEG